MAGLAKQFVIAVDDDFRVRESIESLVESAGYAPLMFSSAEEFLQSGTLIGAKCVITDVRMPGINGIEFAASHSDRAPRPAGNLYIRPQRR
jgi:FixJ family two-component response regulator